MALTVDWPGTDIYVPKADTVFIGTDPASGREIRELDTDQFRKALRVLEDSDPGRPWPLTHTHNPPITLGGVTVARTVEIVNNYSVTFEDGTYAVNLKGSNNNIADVATINQVSIRSSNSAGLQDLSTLLASAYMGEVCIHTTLGQSGTASPIGTRGTPVDNFADALTIAVNLGINRLRLLASATIATDDFSKGYTITGDNAVVVTATLDTSADLTNCEFTNLTIQGVLDGNTVVRGCSIINLTYFDGFIWQCALNGHIDVAPNSQATIAESFSNIPGGGIGQTPSLDLNGTGDLALRGYNGGIEINGLQSSDCDVSLDIMSGRVVFDATCTAGTAYVRGDCQIEDNSAGTTIVDQTGVNVVEVNSISVTGPDDFKADVSTTLAQATLARKGILNRFKINTDNTSVIYDDDGTTPLVTSDLKDIAGSPAYINATERHPQ